MQYLEVLLFSICILKINLLLLIFNLTAFWSAPRNKIIHILWNLVTFSLPPNICIVFLYVPCILEKPRRQWHPTAVLLPGKSHGWRSLVGCSSWGRWLSDFTFTFHFYALEKEMAAHSSVLAWRIPGTAEPGGLPAMGSHRVGHDWSDLAAAAAASLRRMFVF